MDPAARGLVVTSPAETDLTTAYDWYEEQSPGLGAEFLRAVEAVFAAVQRTRDCFRRSEGAHAGHSSADFPTAFSSRRPTTKSSCSPSSTVAGIRVSGNRVLKANVR